MNLRRDISMCQIAVKLTLSRPVRAFNHLRDIETLIRALRVSEAEFGELLAPFRFNGEKGNPYSRASVSAWKTGKHKMSPHVREAIATLIREYTLSDGDWPIYARVKVGARSIRARAMRMCFICYRPFMMKRSDQKKCERHRQSINRRSSNSTGRIR